MPSNFIGTLLHPSFLIVSFRRTVRNWPLLFGLFSYRTAAAEIPLIHPNTSFLLQFVQLHLHLFALYQLFNLTGYDGQRFAIAPSHINENYVVRCILRFGPLSRLDRKCHLVQLFGQLSTSEEQGLGIKDALVAVFKHFGTLYGVVP